LGATAAGIRGAAPLFSLGVSGAVINPSGQVLLLRHAFRRRHPWGLVSGWVNRGESPSDAMRRELREETSLIGEVGPVLLIRGDKRAPSLEVVYLVRVSGGTFRPSGETPEGCWHDLGQTLPDGLHPTHRPVIQLAARVAGVS
jgi:ADP-ribose pyrophosphatase YjhB (NUDIX family)